MKSKLVADGARLIFWCPGCSDHHSVAVSGPNAWGFDGNVAAPTLTPSILLRTGHYCTDHKEGGNCWCTYNERQRAKGGPEAPFRCVVCHSFVRDGSIEFLGDCTHDLAGTTVQLPDLPEEA